MRRSVLVCLAIVVAWLVGTVGWTAPVHDAASKGDVSRVKALLKAEPGLLNTADEDGATPLHWAASTGQKAVVEVLIEHKADVNAQLLWLPDGRLQVTNGDAWQRIYDVRTGEFEEVPGSSIDPDTTTWKPVTVNDAGDEVTATSDGGSVRVVVTGADGASSTIMSEDGGSTYSISTTPTWSPDGTYVLLTDAAARLLVITPDNATTRVLAEELGNSWAITGDDILATDN